MSASLNVVSLSGKPAAGTQGAGAGASASAGGASGASDAKTGFQQLLAVLLDLLSAQGGSTSSAGARDAASAVQSSATTGQSSTVSLDLGGLLDLKALLASAQANGDADASSGTSDAAETPDPLAAILDVLVSALQKASAASTDGSALTLDDKSRDALKALNELLASMTGDKAGKAQAPLPSDVVDKLKALDQLLAKQSGDPQLADLKSRVADLIGRGDAAKPADGDATTQSVAALLGQNGTGKSSGNAQRDVMVHVLDGAKANLNANAAGQDAGTGDSGNKNSSSAQAQAAAGNQSAANKDQSSAGFMPPSAGEASKASQTSDAGTDPVMSVPAHAADKTQQVQFRTVQAAYTPSGKTVDIPQVAFDIARHAVAGINRFQIRLDPPEMGRIDVRLDLHHEGGITARLTVDRPETLDLLQRDARALERALAQTGLDQGKTNLEFSLRQNPFAGQNSGQGQQNDAQSWLGDVEDDGSDPVEASVPPITYYRGSVRPGGVNMVA